jgi:hypothetical protein
MFQLRKNSFNVIAKKYLEYLELYRFFNNGSIEGASPFGYFYRVYTYYRKNFDIDPHK